MRSSLLAFAGLAALAGLHVPAQAQQSENYRTGRQNWLATRYPQSMPPLKTHRAERYGRTAEVDYMLGTSGCRTSGQRSWGARVLNYVLYSYSLTGPSRDQVRSELALCRAAGQLPAVSPEARQKLATFVPAGATARGKMFSFDGDKSIAAYPAKQTRQLTRAELARRLVPLGQHQAITTELRALLPASARVQTVGRYAFAVYGDQSPAQVERIAATLDRYLAYLSSEYAIAAPDSYITIHLVPSIDAVQRVADRVHGLDVSPSTLGYAYQDDLSTVAMIQGTQAGTLLHELFHLIVRQSFGDIPQWLDEGMAGLYEVSSFEGDRLVGLPNWRGRVLQRGWEDRPTLAAVVASPWFAFDLTGNDNPGFVVPDERMALSLATARYLALFLQERGELKKVFDAFRARDPGAAEDPAAGAVALVAANSLPLDQLQVEYDAWLRGLDGSDRTSSSETVGKTLPPNTKQ